MAYILSSIKITFFRSSSHFYQIQSDKVILACCTDETKLWLSPSAKKRRNPCSGPHQWTRIWERAMVGLLKKSIVNFQSGWKEIRSLRSRRLEVVGERENGRAGGRHAPSPLACLLLSRVFFLVPTTSKRLLRRLGNSKRSFGNSLTQFNCASYLPRPLLHPFAARSLVISIYCILCNFLQTANHDFFNLKEPLFNHALEVQRRVEVISQPSHH